MDAFTKLGIDLWGIVLYITSFGVLLGVMTRYVYKPLLAYLDKRRELIQKSVEEAEALRATFQSEIEKQTAENDAYIEGVRKKMAEAQQFAKQSARELIADADARREKILAEAEGQALQIKNRVLDDVEDEIKTRIEHIVFSVLKTAVPKDVIQQSVTKSLHAYKEKI